MNAQKGTAWLDKFMAGASEKIEVKAGLGVAVVIATIYVGKLIYENFYNKQSFIF